MRGDVTAARDLRCGRTAAGQLGHALRALHAWEPSPEVRAALATRPAQPGTSDVIGADLHPLRLGYEVMHEFVEDGVRMGIAMTHPNGGPDFAIRLDTERAGAAAGFDYFAIGVPGRGATEALAAVFTERGEYHAGVLRTPIGWVLLGVQDPDGHDVRFYTVPLELPPDGFGE